MHLFLSCPCRLDGDSVQQDKDALLRKLMEAEEDGSAAAKQVSALRESVSKLCAVGGSVSFNSVFGLIISVSGSICSRKQQAAVISKDIKTKKCDEHRLAHLHVVKVQNKRWCYRIEFNDLTELFPTTLYIFVTLCLSVCRWRGCLAPSLQGWLARRSCCYRNWRHLKPPTERCGTFSESSTDPRYCVWRSFKTLSLNTPESQMESREREEHGSFGSEMLTGTLSTYSTCFPPIFECHNAIRRNHFLDNYPSILSGIAAHQIRREKETSLKESKEERLTEWWMAGYKHVIESGFSCRFTKAAVISWDWPPDRSPTMMM